MNTGIRETAYLAGGCFWGMQDLLRNIPGVIKTEVGYTGGWLDNPEYDDTHDPTTLNRQGNDMGTQYRSTIFYTDETQHATSQAVIQRVNESGKWKRPIVTTLERFDKWWIGEGYHQDFLEKNTGGYTCHFMRG
jgi:peptide methionine sulfoxide reductase MsrA